MAKTSLRRAENAWGDLFVDSSCIDCDTCRWMAPASFGRVGSQSAVVRQPESEEERRLAAAALVACPTASIGGSGKEELLAARDGFPVPLSRYAGVEGAEEARVFHAGYHSEASFGATSWFVHRAPDGRGNLLVDSPRFAKPLVERLEALGGVETILLTHRDDVADHVKFAEHFGATRVLHADDVRRGEAELAGVERLLSGEECIELDEELRVIPVPGHTKGSVCFQWRERFLFTGDHLAWSSRRGSLTAFKTACWYDWDEQRRSMERLIDVPFEWILPGHGRWARLAADEREPAMRELVASMS